MSMQVLSFLLAFACWSIGIRKLGRGGRGGGGGGGGGEGGVRVQCMLFLLLMAADQVV